MQTLIKTWGNQYYTDPLLTIVLCIALIVSLKNRTKYKILKYIPVYIASLLIVFVSGDVFALAYDAKYHINLFWGLMNYIDYIFTLIEMIIFSNFYYRLINSRIVKKIIVVANICFALFFIYMAFKDKDFYQSISAATQSTVYTVEAIILLLIFLFYFIEMLKKPPHPDLKNDPVIWVSTGLFLFLACTLPYSLLENYIRNYPDLRSLYAIFYIFYILLFLMIIRAYLCNPEKAI